MTEEINQKFPVAYKAINDATLTAGFSMASDVHTCSLLSTLATSKPNGKFLEPGTGTGLSTAKGGNKKSPKLDVVLEIY